MYIATAHHSTASPAHQPAALPEITRADVTDYASLALDSDNTSHDPTLLIAALEEIEARRAAIEWLLDADLLCVCLV